ncbi:MAG TPA: sulfur globule protein precursor [Xanthobacteraceae bacterium]
MLRKTIIALAAAATLGVGALASSPASAHWGGGWHHMGFHHGFFFHRAFVGHPFFFRRHFAFVGGPLYLDDDYGCWRIRRVPTYWGWRWRRVWVCG